MIWAPCPMLAERTGERSGQPVLRRLLPAQGADEALARQADQDRHADAVEHGGVAQDLQIVRDRLAEADPRIDAEVFQT